MMNVQNIKDPSILLSVINTALRDEYDSLEDLIYGEDLDFAPAQKLLNENGYFYYEKTNSFILR